MNPGRPFQPRRLEERADWGGFRLERILGSRPVAPGPRSALMDLPGPEAVLGGAMPRTLAYLDASSATPPMVSDGEVAIHVLWLAPGSGGAVFAGEDDLEPGSLVERPCEPGDTLLVPAGARFALGSGMVAFCAGSGPVWEASSPSGSLSPVIAHPPTHGLNVFNGHNRRTICAATPGLLLERWKLTQQLVIDLPDTQARYVTNLVSPVAMSWEGGSDLLDRTASRMIPAGLGRVTFVPDGLGYLLVARVPNLSRDVISPLRGAGYTRSEIASVGVPNHLLEAGPAG